MSVVRKIYRRHPVQFLTYGLKLRIEQPRVSILSRTGFCQVFFVSVGRSIDTATAVEVGLDCDRRSIGDTCRTTPCPLIVRMLWNGVSRSEVCSHLVAVRRIPPTHPPTPSASSRDTFCPHTPPLPSLIAVGAAFAFGRSSDPALSGCSKTVEQALMAWDFLSSSRDLVGIVLPPTKRMIHALTPPTGKVREAPGCTRPCVQSVVYTVLRVFFSARLVGVRSRSWLWLVYDRSSVDRDGKKLILFPLF